MAFWSFDLNCAILTEKKKSPEISPYIELLFCMPEIQRRIKKWQLHKTSFFWPVSGETLWVWRFIEAGTIFLWLLCPSLFYEWSVFHFELLFPCSVYWKLETWQAFPLERNVPSLSWSAEVDACSGYSCLVPILESKLITRCAPVQGRKNKALT